MAYESLLSEFKKKLDVLEASSGEILHLAETGVTYAEKCLKKLRREVLDNDFSSAREEIMFFKYIKPQVFCKLIYYVKLFDIESKRPRGSSKFQIKYLNDHIHKLQVYFNENLGFYHYYRRGATSLDEQYFMRGKTDLRSPSNSLQYLIDEQFSTCQDHTVATIMAFDMLIVYLQCEIEKLENSSDNKNANTMKQASPLFWTSSKTELIELIYALQSCGAINSGTADIKEIASIFEQMFNVDLGNYYHTFIEIRARKSSKTKFLDKLVEVLNKRFEEADQ